MKNSLHLIPEDCLMQMFRRSLDNLVHLIYPDLCFHCEAPLEKGEKTLCPTCLSSLSLEEPSERCCICFAKKEQKRSHCLVCQSENNFFTAKAFAFSSEGAILSLQSYFNSGTHAYLCPSLAAHLVLQWEQLRWPIPDWVLSLSFPWDKKIGKTYDPGDIFGKQVAEMMGSCYSNLFRTSWQGTPYVKKRKCLKGQKVLLIDCLPGREEWAQLCAQELKGSADVRLLSLTG